MFLNVLQIACLLVLLIAFFLVWMITVTGWPALADKYASQKPFYGVLHNYDPCELGMLPLRMGFLLAVGTEDDGLYLKLRFPRWFRLQPLLIPWKDLMIRTSQGFLRSRLEVMFVRFPIVALYLPLSAETVFEAYKTQMTSRRHI